MDTHTTNTKAVGKSGMNRNPSNIEALQEELYEFESYINDIWRFMPIPVAVLTPMGIFIDTAEAIEKLLGYDKDDIVGRTFDDIAFPPARIEEILRTTLEQGQVTEKECFLRNKKGGVIQVVVSTLARRDDEGNVITIFISFFDITRRVKTEEELRTASKLESLGILAGGIAHDFNNILMSILGNISLAMLEADPGSEIQQILTDAEASCEQAGRLAHQLLTFARGGRPIKEVTSLQKLLRDTTLFTLSGSRVRCCFSLPDDLWPAELDRGQIGQVVNNLVINAVQAMPDGGEIKITAENFEADKSASTPIDSGRYVRISIQDIGEGIPAKVIHKIFDPYYTTRPKGSGLGLATAYSIINNHGGKLTVNSRPGIGTTFFILLPATEKIVEEKEVGEAQITFGHGRILIMDDEKEVLAVAERMGAYLGYEVASARDGSEAIDKYREAQKAGCPFSAVILDLTVPGGLGGSEAVKKLLEIDPEARVIVSSGYSNDPIMAAYREAGFSGIMAKPYRVQELSEVLGNVIKPQTSIEA
jgi:PAS domain S-box-containing protein